MTIEFFQTIPRHIVAGLISASFLVCANPLLAVERTDPSAQIVSEPDLLVKGAVEKVDLSLGFAVVAGQRVDISTDTVLLENEGAISSGLDALRLLQEGDFVSVNGLLGRPAASVMRMSESYVPGATSIFVRGRVSKLDETIGVATIGGLKIDVTPAMGSTAYVGVRVGELIEAIGIQPEIGGSLIASSIRFSAITGTSLVTPRAITGTSYVTPRAITGTSAMSPRAITGTSLVTPRAITGTSMAAPRAITGTSEVASRAITGTSLVTPRAITGTSMAAPRAITGTSEVAPRAITGTSLVTPRAITGTSMAAPRAITGTSLVTLGAITGTSEVTPRAITGTSH